MQNKNSEYYRYGYRVGHATARNCKRQISMCGRRELAELVGQKLKSVAEKLDKFITTSNEWSEGFFDGFLDGGEEFLEIGRD